MLQKNASSSLNPDTLSPAWSRRLILIAYLAKREGYSVEFVPYNRSRLSEGFMLSELFINNKHTTIQVVQNVQRRPTRKQALAHTGIYRDTLINFDVVCMIVVPPGYPMKILHVPAEQLLREYFDGETKNVRKTFGIPLVYRPENPRFDFLGYEDYWEAYDI